MIVTLKLSFLVNHVENTSYGSITAASNSCPLRVPRPRLPWCVALECAECSNQGIKELNRKQAKGKLAALDFEIV